MDPNILKADVLVTLHLAFVAFVVVGQLLIVVGAVCGWKWVRDFWFRAIHLLSIGVVAAEGLAGVECPLTGWERDLRGGNLFATEGSCWLGRVANGILFYQIDPSNVKYFQYGHIAFGVLVLLTFLLAPPRLPWRKRPAAAPEPEPAVPAKGKATVLTPGADPSAGVRVPGTLG
jgi:hypothetical protein